MSDPVSSIRNLGEASDAVYARAGIHTAEELRTLGPDEAYRRLLATGSRPHFIAYYAMVMGLQGRPWNDCKGKEKDTLRARFDALRAEATANKPPEDKMEAILDEIGIRQSS
ncbi:TfoX/Sxy family DNA transformation protein [Aliiroseovarius marinus]|uniref:TfoX/Sxy family DNA transformation protein n=1 Tax=Aliiroseovarius marinus TaxID=2500159 RepID=UPI001061A9ED|nr:TfoX/Sxy family DNA transformation protein [Aliiroseovarius marinus]